MITEKLRINISDSIVPTKIFLVAQLLGLKSLVAGTVEYTDSFSAERSISPNVCSDCNT